MFPCKIEKIHNHTLALYKMYQTWWTSNISWGGKSYSLRFMWNDSWVLAETIQCFLMPFLFWFAHIRKSSLLKIIEEKSRREKIKEYFSFSLEDKGTAGCNGWKLKLEIRRLGLSIYKMLCRPVTTCSTNLCTVLHWIV